MKEAIDQPDDRGIERLCKKRERFVAAPTAPGIERIEALFYGNMFTPHRHDTYALGITLQGIQTFNYRGEFRASNPGNIIILHPDELHDGGAGTDDGLQYRMLYLEPALLRSGLDHESAPCPLSANRLFRTRCCGRSWRLHWVNLNATWIRFCVTSLLAILPNACHYTPRHR